MLPSPEDELADWDAWIEKASHGPFANFRLGRLSTRLKLHIIVRQRENTPSEQIEALQQRVAKIDHILDERGAPRG